MKIPVKSPVMAGEVIVRLSTLWEDLLSFYHKIKPKLGDYVSDITEIKYGDVDDVVLTLNQKTDIYWGQPKDKNLNDKISKLLQVLDFLYGSFFPPLL